MIEPRLLKGFRDFSTEQMLKRMFVIDKIRKVIESYGYDEIQTPTLEFANILVGNIGNDEKLIYRFSDDGKRDIALKYDHTVGACRYIAMNYNTLPMPFKRYQIQNSFRAENTQKGRYREFLQFDADIFGVEEVGADIEMIILTCEIYKALGFTDFCVYVSDRELIADVPYEVIATIDKIDKVGKEGVIQELAEKGYENAVEVVEKVLSLQPNKRIQQIIKYATIKGFGNHVLFDPSIMRSFSYSTGTIWEVKVAKYPGSLLGGERFDSLVSRFAKVTVPGIGFGLGFDRTIEAMDAYGLIPEMKTHTHVMISVYNPLYLDIYLEYAQLLRQEGFNTEVYPVYEDKLGKQFKYADKKGIPFVITIGDQEIHENTVHIKNLINRVESTVALSEAISMIKVFYEK